MLDLTLTLNHFKKNDAWIIAVDGINFKNYLEESLIPDQFVVFIGFIKTDEDFKLIYDRIAKHPKEIIPTLYLSNGKPGCDYNPIDPHLKK